MPDFELAYPDEVSPTATYVPSRQGLLPGNAEGPNPGVEQEMLADGSVRSKRIYAPVGFHSREFTHLTATDRTNREAFFEAVEGIRSFRMRDGITSSWVWVKFTGKSLAPAAWRTVGVGFWARGEEFVEVPVPSEDALGSIRQNTIVFTDFDTEEDVLFDSAFADSTYQWFFGMKLSSGATSSTPFEMTTPARTGAGFRLALPAPPGSGETITVYVTAIR